MSTRAGYAGRSRPRGAPREWPGSAPRLRSRHRRGPSHRHPAHRRPRARSARPRSPREVPSNKQRRQAAQRRLQRQLERREELARKRCRNLRIGGTVDAVLAVVGAVFVDTGLGDDEADTAASAGEASTRDYPPADPTPNPDLADVGLPSGDVPTSGTQAVTMSTNFGDIGLTLDQAGAPCAAGAILYLAQQGFFDGATCHR